MSERGSEGWRDERQIKREREKVIEGQGAIERRIEGDR